MKIKIGEKIRELRRRDGMTQEELAALLGVTAQAVSRWESGIGYPDIEMIPSAANCFGVTIDELYGFEGERECRIDGLIERVNELDRANLRGDNTVDECITLLREGLAEFPGSERLTYRLAKLLADTGWTRHHEWMHYGDDGYIVYEFDRHRKNPYWSEAMRLFEGLAENASDEKIKTDAVCELILLCRTVGECEKAMEYASRLPHMVHCRELMAVSAVYGREQSKHLGNALLTIAYNFAETLMYALVNNIRNYDTEMPIEKVNGAISLFGLICDDGNFGIYHREVAFLYLYLSRLEWQYGRHDEAFESLDNALDHAKKYDSFVLSDEPHYTAPLVKDADVEYDCFRDDGHFAEHLSEDWPMWCNPDYTQVKAEMTSDVRWSEWVKRTKSPQDDRPCLTQPLN